jgi:hypothetical protein
MDAFVARAVVTGAGLLLGRGHARSLPGVLERLPYDF